MLLGYNCKIAIRAETEFVMVLLIWLGYVRFIRLLLCHYILQDSSSYFAIILEGGGGGGRVKGYLSDVHQILSFITCMFARCNG